MDGALWEHIAASLLRVTAGFGLAIAVAVPLGLWMGRVHVVYSAINPVLQILRPISPIALDPDSHLWFGVGNASPVFLIFISSVFPMTVQTTVGVHRSSSVTCAPPRTSGSLAKLLRRSGPAGRIATDLVGMRIALGVAWLVVVAAEMIALRSGLGYMIMDSRDAGNRYDLVIAVMISSGSSDSCSMARCRLLEGLKSVRWRYAR